VFEESVDGAAHFYNRSLPLSFALIRPCGAITLFYTPGLFPTSALKSFKTITSLFVMTNPLQASLDWFLPRI